MSDLNEPQVDEEEKEQVEPVIEPDISLNTRPLPIIIVLIAAAVSCVLSVLQSVEFSVFFMRLLKSVLIFAVLGTVIKMILDFIFNRKKSPEEEESTEEPENINIENEEDESFAEDGGQLMDEEPE